MSQDPRIGTVLDGLYRLDLLLGQGGAGAVFAARHLGLERTVAVKLLHPHFAQMDELLQRFLREAKLLSGLGHPAFVTVYDFGQTEDGTAYLTMELVEGQTLRERLRGGPLPIGEVLALFEQLCGAMAQAHDKGVLHRDLKPENLMLLPSGRLKILDFGLAKLLSDQTPLTADKAVPGTINYIAPERAIGRKDADARSDLFALGAILYECLTGRLAFPGKAPASTLQRVLRAPVPSLELEDRELAGRLDEVIATACAKDPRDRFATARALWRELEAAAHGGPTLSSATLPTLGPPPLEVKAGVLLGLLDWVRSQYGEAGLLRLRRALGEERLDRYLALLPNTICPIARLELLLGTLRGLFDDGSLDSLRRAGRHCAQQLLLAVYRGFLSPGSREAVARRAQVLFEALLPGAVLRLQPVGDRFCLEIGGEPAPDAAIVALCAGWLARYLELCGAVPISLREEQRYRDGQPAFAITFAFSI